MAGKEEFTGKVVAYYVRLVMMKLGLELGNLSRSFGQSHIFIHYFLNACIINFLRAFYTLKYKSLSYICD